MAAQIGPDWVQGIAGFGSTVPNAIRDLAYAFADLGYDLRGNAAGVEVAGEFIQVTASPGQSPADVLLTLATMIEERGYQESDFSRAGLGVARPQGAAGPGGSVS